MLERRMRVCAVGAKQVELLPASRCEDCAQCSGRCNGILSALSVHRPFAVPRRLLPAVHAGDEILLRGNSTALARAARSVYGSALVGVLLGALVGATLANLAAAPIDGSVVLGAATGLALAIWRSRSTAIPQGFEFVFLNCTSEERRP